MRMITACHLKDGRGKEGEREEYSVLADVTPVWLTLTRLIASWACCMRALLVGVLSDSRWVEPR